MTIYSTRLMKGFKGLNTSKFHYNTNIFNIANIVAIVIGGKNTWIQILVKARKNLHSKELPLGIIKTES